MTIIIHTTVVDVMGVGVALLGSSGSGKSSLALRLMDRKSATLVADDYAEIGLDGPRLTARAPDTIKGLMEVRGIGICDFPFRPEASLDLLVDLGWNDAWPSDEQIALLLKQLPKIRLNAFDESAPIKVELAARYLPAR